MAKITAVKAKKILKDKSVRGHKLTGKQKRFFGLIAGGGHPTRLSEFKKKARKLLKLRR